MSRIRKEMNDSKIMFESHIGHEMTYYLDGYQTGEMVRYNQSELHDSIGRIRSYTEEVWVVNSSPFPIRLCPTQLRSCECGNH